MVKRYAQGYWPSLVYAIRLTYVLSETNEISPEITHEITPDITSEITP